ncbi:hypothetical protein RDMS_13490 [Deinococcus sp. RL]|uniref:PilW family protein n=1 Tax=Deinococcus sp. RL TaxID=1489678 RepID=UPI0004D78E80|nr:prepilin-type N-terminal cleavage/methylation domain-containing protein [Deinococcus sp. RL]KEF33276.1 hypothetical protein RDMS_13490 [Deinococcus sp. RL]
MRQAGLTLVELLVGMALMGIVLAALVAYFSQSGRVSAQSSTRAELQQEVLNAQQLIAGKLKEAWYVYPPGQTIAMTTSNLTKRPTGAGHTWTVGTDPIVAMVLPPETPGGAYRFLAYYPVQRALWVSGTATESWRNPGPDSANENTWVLAEYRGSIAPGAGGAPPATPPSVPTGNTANLLADYIAPTIQTTGFTTPSNTYTMFTYGQDADGTVRSVTLNLAVARQSGGTLMRLPGPTGTYSTTVFPANIGRVAAN